MLCGGKKRAENFSRIPIKRKQCSGEVPEKGVCGVDVVSFHTDLFFFLLGDL